MSKQRNNDEAEDFAAEVEALMAATRRAANAERVMLQGFYLSHLDDADGPKLAVRGDRTAAQIEWTNAILDLLELRA